MLSFVTELMNHLHEPNSSHLIHCFDSKAAKSGKWLADPCNSSSRISEFLAGFAIWQDLITRIADQ